MCCDGAQWSAQPEMAGTLHSANAFPSLYTKETEALKGKGKGIIAQLWLTGKNKSIHFILRTQNKCKNAENGLPSHSPSCQSPRNICQTRWNWPFHLARNKALGAIKTGEPISHVQLENAWPIQTPGWEQARFFPDLIQRTSSCVFPWCWI